MGHSMHKPGLGNRELVSLDISGAGAPDQALNSSSEQARKSSSGQARKSSLDQARNTPSGQARKISPEQFRKISSEKARKKAPGYRLITLALSFVLLLFGFFNAASAETREDSEASAEEQPGYVYVDGQRVIGVFGSNGPLTKTERVKLIQSRLDNIYALHDFNAEEFHAVPDEFGTRIFYKDQVVMLVSNEEAQSIKISSAGLAADYIKRLKAVAEQYKQDSRPGRLALGAAGVIVGLLLLTIFVSNLSNLSQLVSKYLVLRVQTSFKDARAKGAVIKDLLELSVTFLTRTFFFAVFLALLHFYIFSALNFFPWTKIYGLQLMNKTITPLSSGLHSLSEYIPNFFVLMVIGYLTYGVLVVLRFFFDEVSKSNLTLQDFDPDWAEPTYKLIKALTIFMALVVAAPYLPGWDSPAFKQIGLFIGLLISLGSTGAIGHLVAGVVLTYTRAFKLGDRVKIGDHVGDVVERTLFTTRIKTIKNEMITIHNGQLVTTDITNYSSKTKEQGLILHTSVTIGYDAPWRQVHELLIKAAKECPEIMQEPEPFVLQRALNDFYVEYELNAYTRHAENMVGIYSQLHAAIQDCFNASGVEIMSPHYASLRDGNEITIPAKERSKDYSVPGFKVESVKAK